MPSLVIRIVLVFMLAVALISCGQSNDSQPVTVTESDNGAIVTLHQGQLLLITLHGYDVTGASWITNPDAASILTQQGDPLVTTDTSPGGSGVVITYTYKAIAAGSATMGSTRYVRDDRLIGGGYITEYIGFYIVVN